MALSVSEIFYLEKRLTQIRGSNGLLQEVKSNIKAPVRAKKDKARCFICKIENEHRLLRDFHEGGWRVVRVRDGNITPDYFSHAPLAALCPACTGVDSGGISSV